MYKSRFYLWASILLIVFLIKTISTVDVSSLVIQSKEVAINVDTNTFFKSNFLASKTGQIKFMQTTSNPLVYIKESSNENIDGFEKIDDAIFSPIILYVPVDDELSSDVFYNLGDSNFVSFKTLVNAIIEDKPLSTFGIEEKGLKDKTITFNIPSKDSFYYDEVVEQIYIALNNNRIPNEEERASLKETVDKLLSKSVECNDVVAKIESLKDDSYNIFIAPEFIIDTSNDFSASSGYGNYDCVLFEKSVCVGYDVFVKEDAFFGDENLIEIIKESVLNNPDFVDGSNHRTIYEHDYSYLFNGTQPDNLDICFIN